jgi:acetoin utilization deacetylase AcuC-like enzyme
VLKNLVVPLADAFNPSIMLMIDGSDPHFTDRITEMGLTLEGIRQIGEVLGHVADRLCEGKLIDFTGSGYSRDLRTVALGWLASIAGVTGTEIDLEENASPSRRYNADQDREQAQDVVQEVRSSLAPWWSCFQ